MKTYQYGKDKSHFTTTDGISNVIETASLSVSVVGGAVGASGAVVLHAAAGTDLYRGGWKASLTLCSNSIDGLL